MPIKITRDYLIETETVSEYASKLTTDQLNKISEEAGHNPMDFIALKFLGVKNGGLAFEAASFNDAEGGFIVGKAIVGGKPVLYYEPVPDFEDEDMDKALDFLANVPEYRDESPAL